MGILTLNLTFLKVPKCENFYRTDFFDFYTIKPLWVGDFREKIKNNYLLSFARTNVLRKTIQFAPSTFRTLSSPPPPPYSISVIHQLVKKTVNYISHGHTSCSAPFPFPAFIHYTWQAAWFFSSAAFKHVARIDRFQQVVLALWMGGGGG